MYTFCMGTIGFFIPKNMGIDIKIVTLPMLEPKLWPNYYVIAMSAILHVSNEVEGREKLNPNISGLFDP